jgi:hypothetical protein
MTPGSPLSVWSRRGLSAAAVATALAACLAAPPPPPVCPAPVAAVSAPSAPVPSASATAIASATAPPPRLRPASPEFGGWVCGKPWLPEGQPRPRRPYPRGECLIDTGCDPTWLAMQPPVEACPERVPVVTMEQLVRGAPDGPASGDPVIVRGRLVSFHGLLAPAGSSIRRCGLTHPLLALEVPVGTACYGLGLSGPFFGCMLDDTKVCCDHLPVGEQITVVGTYAATSAGQPDFSGWVEHARMCTLAGGTR